MTDSHKKLVGVIGSGLIGRDPWDRRSWSTISYFLFTELKQQRLLERAFGVEVNELKRRLLMLKNVNLNRQVWQNHFYMDPAYRRALTEEVRKALLPTDKDCDFLQLGAMYDVPQVTSNRVFSYHDGNMATSLASPYSPKGLSPKKCKAGLAFEKRVYDGLTAIMTMSEFLRQSFINDFDQPPEKVHCVQAGINLEAAPDAIAERSWDEPNILFIGVDFPRKGGPQLLKAFPAIRDRHPHARLHIVGPEQIDQNLLSAGVEFHGYLRKTEASDRQLLGSLFAKATLFVMPSLYEPFGIAPLEAMVHGIPAIVTNRWALEEMVTPGVNGDHVEQDSVDSLVETIVKCLDSPDKLQEMGQAGRDMVLSKYTWPQVIKNMEQVFAAQPE